MLERARDAHTKVDFGALAAGPEWGGPWERVESADRFVVFRGQAGTSSKCMKNGVEVMCAGQLDASVEEVASILRSNSEAEYNAAMTGLYNKGFIFGSFEREVPCSESENQDDDDDDDIEVDSNEQLVVRTKSFSRTAMLGRNEQWCYFDYYQRKKEQDGSINSTG
ncbi:uncharacterized protein IUM83_12887 [Phytophthora cinnamomi]|uniref:uncharacterized protein n=1 Tax=Phytophthora cinnamomi TaxID=4785 RepID=UPI0035599E82|nr:hypothetical protein IUM83_12887 [Phytophthora cinnamomi]